MLSRIGVAVFKTLSIFAVTVAVVATFLLAYSYVGGDSTDRKEMQASAQHLASYFRLVPVAQASVQVTEQASLGEPTP